jgi:hypothetical protein
MPHYVKPYIDGDNIGLDFECTEPEGSLCRMMCPPGDGYGCESVQVDQIDGEWWHTAIEVYNADSDRLDLTRHKMVPAGRCTILDWDDKEECFGDGKTPLREGEIEFSWNGDFYEWRYVEPMMTVKVSNLQGDNVTEHTIPVSLWERIQAVREDDERVTG